MNLEQLKTDWIVYEKEKIEDKKKRRYLHFDSKIFYVDKKILDDVLNPDFVIRRFFYPFIKDFKIERKYKIKDGKKGINKKLRPLCYAAHKDAFIFSWYSYVLNSIYNEKIKKLGISDNVIAYRNLERNNVNFAKEVFNYIKNKKDCTAVCFDIQGFFDNLSHKRIKSTWRKLLLEVNLLNNNNLPPDHYAVFKAVTNYSFVNKKEIFPYFNIDNKNIKSFSKICSLNDYKKIIRNTKLISKNNSGVGIPQGVAISSVLSNAYMLDFDINVNNYINSIGGLYRRYCDDIIVICDTKQYSEVKKFIQSEITNIDLIIQEEKTDVVIFSSKLDGTMQCTDEDGNKTSLRYLGVETNGIIEKLRDKTLSKNDRKIFWLVKKEMGRSKKSKNNFSTGKIYKRFLYKDKLSFKAYGKKSAIILGSSALHKQFSNINIIRVIRKKIRKLFLK